MTTTTAHDTNPDVIAAMRAIIPAGLREYRAVIVFRTPQTLTEASIRKFMHAMVDTLHMTLAVPGIVTGWCEHGLAGWAHITTSGAELMGYPQRRGGEFVSMWICSCRDFRLDAVIALAAAAFDVPEGQIAGTRVLAELAAG
jgi:hypothetical protein